MAAHLQSEFCKRRAGPHDPIKNPGRSQLLRPGSSSLEKLELTGRVRRARPAAAEVEAEAADKSSSPGSPIRPGTSASPEAAGEAAGAEEAVAEEAEPRWRNYRSSSA